MRLRMKEEESGNRSDSREVPESWQEGKGGDTGASIAWLKLGYKGVRAGVMLLSIAYSNFKHQACRHAGH